MLRLILIFWIIFLTGIACMAEKIDSLETEIISTGNKRKKVDLMNMWVEKNYWKFPEKALGRSNEAGQLSQSIKYSRGVANSHLNIAKSYQVLHENDSALDHYLIALSIFKELTYDSRTAESLHRIASIYFSTSNYKAALQYANEALDLYEIVDDRKTIASLHALLCDIKSILGFKTSAIEDCRKSLILYESLKLAEGKTKLLNSLGKIYLDLKQYQRCEEYFNRALYMAKFEQDSSIIADTYNNLGNVFIGMGEHDKAIQYFTKALNLNLHKGNNLGIGYSYYNLGISFAGTSLYDSALIFLEKSLQFSQQYSDLELQAKNYSEIGKLYAEKRENDLAVDYLMDGVIIAEKLGADPILQNCYFNLANYYDEIGDNENALNYFKLYMLHKDEIFENQSTLKIAEAEALYNLEKKDKQIQLLRSENRIKDLEASERNLMNIWLITGLIFVFTTMIILYRQYRMQNRANQILHRQNEAIERQKEEIIAQRNDIEKINQILTEKNNQITDSIQYAKRIQLSLLPDDELLRRYFKNSFILFLPKDIVSGDFYWLKNTNDVMCIAIVDCTGHGVPGAFMTLLANSLLNQATFGDGEYNSPSRLLYVLDEKVKQSLNQHGTTFSTFEGMDMAFCMINLQTRQINYSGAKIPLYYKQNGILQQVIPDRVSIGGNEIQDKKFTDKTILLNKGDSIYLATDGFQDQFGGEKGKKYMKLHFRQLIEQVSSLQTDKQKDTLYSKFNEWKGFHQQTDDVLVVGIEL
jgi:serine phosphatase RsbU (regulator of sigma subunit)/Tfp pilus assembly protein PilF